MGRIYHEYAFGISQGLVNQLNDDDRKLVFNFFVTFSRLEYALMKCGYAKGDEDWAWVDWEKFADDFQGNFQQLLDTYRHKELKEAVDYYRENPPRKQVLKNGIVSLRPENPKEKLLFKELMNLVKRVRNNLFHGEKLNKLLGGNSERDRELLQHGFVLLYACIDINKDLKRYFFMN